MKKTLIACLTAIAVVGFGGLLRAQDEAGGWTVGVAVDSLSFEQHLDLRDAAPGGGEQSLVHISSLEGDIAGLSLSLGKGQWSFQISSRGGNYDGSYLDAGNGSVNRLEIEREELVIKAVYVPDHWEGAWVWPYFIGAHFAALSPVQ